MVQEILEGVQLETEGKLSPAQAKTVRLRLRSKIRLNVETLTHLIDELTKLRDEMANTASIEFFIEDVE